MSGGRGGTLAESQPVPSWRVGTLRAGVRRNCHFHLCLRKKGIFLFLKSLDFERCSAEMVCLLFPQDVQVWRFL